MGNLYYVDNKDIVFHRIEDSIAALPDSVLFLCRQLQATRRSRIVSQRLDTGHDQAQVLLRNVRQFFGGGLLDLDPIAWCNNIATFPLT